jgi:hypothetical protein
MENIKTLIIHAKSSNCQSEGIENSQLLFGGIFHQILNLPIIQTHAQTVKLPELLTVNYHLSKCPPTVPTATTSNYQALNPPILNSKSSFISVLGYISQPKSL